MDGTQQPAATEKEAVQRFLRDYYQDEIGELVERYPREQTSLRVSWRDLYQFDADFAEAVVQYPDEKGGVLTAALREYDLPVDVELSKATVRIRDMPSERRQLPSDLTTEDSGYVALDGDLARVTAKQEIGTEIAFRCVRCESLTPVSQTPGEFQEPHQCRSCERQGPFNIDDDQTTWRDFCQVRLETPPELAGSAQGEHIDGYAIGDTVHIGGEHGLLGRAGERVTVYGKLERELVDEDTGTFERYIEIRDVEFPDDGNTVDVASHRSEFEELAERDDAVDLLAESVAPALYATDAWETGMEWAVAYLFGSPRIELPDGTVYRGDIHGAIISDYGMGKSMFSHGVENLSPDCIRKSATSLSSDVGLTAAAVRDDFAGSQWTLRPGILVRGDGGHVILDEVDKGPDDLHKMNDAIEGQQRVDVEKAGLSATYSSKVGLLVMGNPNEGRFDPNIGVGPQIGVDSSLLSRFDGIITMRDIADEQIDGKIAKQIAEGYAEANQLRYGDLDREDFEALDRPVDADVAQAWIKHAREEVNPVFSKDLIDDIREWYASEVRQLNASDTEDLPVPVTARVVMWVIRFSMSFARCHLRNRVTESDVDRAMTLAKRLVAQNWDGEQFVPEEMKSSSISTQNDRITAIKDTLNDADEPLTPQTVADRTSLTPDTAESELERMANEGQVYRPENGTYEVM